MRFKKLDLNLLVALDALLTEKNVTRAGERVFLSQSTMSNALSRLRQYFDDELLVQVGGRMELTPRAELLHEAVRDVLVRIDTTVAARPAFDPTASDREFTLFVSDYSMEVLVPGMLALTSQRGSRARFNLKPQVNQPHRHLERGEADLLIIPENFCSPDHPLDQLFDDRFVCVVWRESPLALGSLTMERYMMARHVSMRPPDGSLPVFDTWLANDHGLTREIGLTTYSFSAMPYLVVGTDLIATVHSRLASKLQGLLPIEIRPVPMPMKTLHQAMQWHKYRSRDPGLIWLRDLLREAADQLPSAAHESSTITPSAT
ncbi:LysR family transcriptional regulator [Hydrogenophaga taeniospiralis CCUG 15921]|uniref:LysR family transcriptional regulator n=1 Tax=Hydrogenophaga taeniospiralis CCUG 15921 TaxID=1281780 RepID=A0A9X4NRE7_9BURK|nr:LysR family transcriptional regulator [Hydrogenophaga taeniospiralis]MDG5975266.1 LysR family transcriptional regulator [Hydrogenophaga taeniospiralis CCUG 15921]